ncbi:hypothetical protein [Streptomyces viridochromogenes]|uniref:hypothetical protein n=1 Tax=Streptomyces viridochromogenes TaxID=1938 RepID=UPI00069DE5A0|nr:hypothetical protein [Streptomyces viridochromogenes]KOG22067.1 hypothetical protein ADK36_14145 [Streptomyces viridochromogenes]KOG29974.1 hypothetical protein ADK35_01580 [Streptomyces viridochromogenes]
MSVDQLPSQIREFVNYLDGLLARLDQGAGWCGVFWQRDPEGMQACLDGREVPPWDVVEALLHDLAGQYGPGGAAPETERARTLHAAALAAYDTRPGGRDALGDRLDVMLREQRYAAERQAELSRSLASAGSQEQADAIRLDLAWARDDHERASARCTELRTRMADLDRRAASVQGQAIRRERVAEGSVFRVEDRFGGDGFGGDGFRDVGAGVGAGADGAQPGEAGSAGGGSRTMPGQRDARPAAGTTSWAAEEQGNAAAGEKSRPDGRGTPRKRRRGSARFAGMVEEDSAPVVVPPAAPSLPTLPAQPVTRRRTPRGARFAGAEAGAETPATPTEPQAEPMGVADRREVVGTVETLVRLRGEGRTGEAHALLVETAYWPAVRFPLLAAEMQRAGLGADWATLLWEAASLPAERLVAAADALTAAGRAEDGEQILRQGVGRPAHEIGQAVVALAGEGRHREVRALLDAYVRVRTPEEAARSVAADPKTLVPLLLAAAQGVSDECQWDLVHALRVAGHTA